MESKAEFKEKLKKAFDECNEEEKLIIWEEYCDETHMEDRSTDSLDCINVNELINFLARVRIYQVDYPNGKAPWNYWDRHIMPDVYTFLPDELRYVLDTYWTENEVHVPADTDWWHFDDGGRDKYFEGFTGDCACRAIAIATETDYKEVYDLINEYAKKERIGKRKKKISSARKGVYQSTTKKIMTEHFGWKWHPCMGIGTGCQVHANAEELPNGRLILDCSKHYTAMIDGVIHDTYDPSRGGTRCVYGYYSKE